MIYPSADFDAALAAVCHGTATEMQSAELQALLRECAAARDAYLWRVELHARLASGDDLLTLPPAVGGLHVENLLSTAGGRSRAWKRSWLSLAAVVAALLLAGLVFWRPGGPGARDEQRLAAATIGELQNVRWVAAEADFQPGDVILAQQRLEVSSGQVRLDFGSGASVLVEGPAIIDVESTNSAFLLLGRLTATASTPESKGFTIRTRNARVVDLGTEFTAEAVIDGDSRFSVISGEIEIHTEGSAAPHRLGQGDLLSVEAGRSQVIVRVERGDETPAFRFPTIEPPSDRDYADARQGHADVRIVQGKPHVRSVPEFSSAPPSVLVDGRGQSAPDAPRESLFFADATTGRVLMDLRRPIAITRINTYSWHQNPDRLDVRVRATQQYTLYGFAGDDLPATEGDLENAGWIRIARVNTDEVFQVIERLDRPAQQACSITSANGAVGRYRYLLWDVQPSRHPDFSKLNNTFYGEFDVYAEP